MNWQDYIEGDPEIMLGKPVFKGTRIAVEFVLEELGNGRREEDLLQSHPRLKPEHLRAALLYAASIVSSERMVG